MGAGSIYNGGKSQGIGGGNEDIDYDMAGFLKFKDFKNNVPKDVSDYEYPVDDKKSYTTKSIIGRHQKPMQKKEKVVRGFGSSTGKGMEADKVKIGGAAGSPGKAGAGGARGRIGAGGNNGITKAKSVKDFAKEMNVLMNKGDYEGAKKTSEKALAAEIFGTKPNDGNIYLVCSKANYYAGYLPFAEQLGLKCLDYDDEKLLIEANWLLGQIYRALGNTD